MVDEKQTYEHYDSLAIPTYDEAVTSRPSSSQSLYRGPSEVSQDAERQGLLGPRAGQQEGYHAPTVESVRSSLDLSSSGGGSRADSTEELRHEIQQMDVEEPYSRLGDRSGSRFSKRISSLTHSFSSLHLPFRQWLPSSDYIKDSLPGFKLNSILLMRAGAFFLVLGLAYLLFASNLMKSRRQGSKWFDPEVLRLYIRDHISGESIHQNLKILTSGDHAAGTLGGLQQAKYIERLFGENQLENVVLEQFDVYLNFPKDGGRKVAIIDPPELAWEAAMEEDPVYLDRKQTPAFHGYSRAGNVTGPLIYANYGSRDDFKHLESKGINLTGSVVLIRYYGTQPDRALKVKAAELAGSVGVILYSDPADDGFVLGKAYPDGRYMPSDGVQRGSVALTSWIVGDPLTPGFASLPETERRNFTVGNPALNNIPSIPLAWRDAQTLLQSLKSHGVKLGADEEWGVGGVPDVEWWSGDSSSPTVHLRNLQDEEERRPIYNILGEITGIEQPEKAIIVGNHYDAWTFGAADPSSGTAIFLEVIRVFGELRAAGWKPLRSIYFRSWDGEEYNLVGSTEHVEARIDGLRLDGMAYLNVDVGVVGTDFEASASPALATALLHVLERVLDPASNKTLRTLWAEKGSSIQGLGAGSDYVAFQDLAGTSSLDMTFGGPPYPYHSGYDTLEWMEHFGDPPLEDGEPGFQYHKTLAIVWALLIMDLADSEILPFDFNAYADAVQIYITDLENHIKNLDGKLDIKPLEKAAQELSENAKLFTEWGQAWANLVYRDGGGFESNAMAIKRMSYNTRMSNFETNLLDIQGGLRNREQYKHVIFGPERWNAYGASFFPSIRDAIEDGDWELAQQQVEKVSQILSYASRKLNT